MGMAASQARFLQLTARKTNIEFMGQQINQERLALANESAGLFERSLTLNAPTPPSSLNDEYFTPAYSFTDSTSGEDIKKKILVGYSEGSITGAVLIYDTYLPDGTIQESVELYVGSDVGTATGIVGDDGSAGAFEVNNNTYTPNVDASLNTIKNITFDPSTGRLMSFDYGDTGEEVTYDSGDIIYSAEFNDDLFDDAMNKYEYEKATYDYEIERINLETSRLQQQDKSLELKLKKLDTEHTAIQTEIDSVQKVIQKNIESSFKTFS